MNTSSIMQTIANAPPPAPPPKPSRMSLDHTVDGVRASPMRILIYGGEKIGKSSFAAGAPSPVWLGADSGTDHLNIRRLPQPETYAEILEGIHEVATRGPSKGIRTLVLDPLNWFESLVVADVVGPDNPNMSLADFGGGYGKGNAAAILRWRRIQEGLERAWKAGLNIILCAHSHVKRFEDPQGPGYERFELAMDVKAAGLFKQSVDAVLFAEAESYGKIDPRTKKAKAFGSAARVLHTEYAPAYDAGNRWRLPKTLPLSWAAFAEAKANGEAQIRAFRQQIEEGLAELADPVSEARVRSWMADPNVDIAEIANAVAAKLGELRAAVTEEEAKS